MDVLVPPAPPSSAGGSNDAYEPSSYNDTSSDESFESSAGSFSGESFADHTGVAPVDDVTLFPRVRGKAWWGGASL